MNLRVLYALTRDGWIATSFTKQRPCANSMLQLVTEVLKNVPPPKAILNAPFKMPGYKDIIFIPKPLLLIPDASYTNDPTVDNVGYDNVFMLDGQMDPILVIAGRIKKQNNNFEQEAKALDEQISLVPFHHNYTEKSFVININHNSRVIYTTTMIFVDNERLFGAISNNTAWKKIIHNSQPSTIDLIGSLRERLGALRVCVIAHASRINAQVVDDLAKMNPPDSGMEKMDLKMPLSGMEKMDLKMPLGGVSMIIRTDFPGKIWNQEADPIPFPYPTAKIKEKKRKDHRKEKERVERRKRMGRMGEVGYTREIKSHYFTQI